MEALSLPSAPCARSGCPLPAAPTVDALGRPARYCSARCRATAQHQTPAAVRSQALRFARWYTLNASWQAWRTILRRSDSLTPEREAALQGLRGRGHVPPDDVRALLGLPAVDPEVSERHAEVAAWRAHAPRPPGAPPGTGPCSLVLDPHRTLTLAQTPALHGLLTALHGGAHHTHAARWSLRPWRAGCGWAVVWRDAEGAAVAGTVHDRVRLGADHHVLIVGCAGTLRWPDPSTWRRPYGRQRLRLDTLTPVVIRSGLTGLRRELKRQGLSVATHPTKTRTEARPEHLLSALSELAARVGVEVDRSKLRLVVTEAETEPSVIEHRGKLGGDGRIRGWSGRLLLECNAPVRWLLELAAAGWGLGGRTAYGYGAVVVVREV